jgi:hypothetical protein
VTYFTTTVQTRTGNYSFKSTTVCGSFTYPLDKYSYIIDRDELSTSTHSAWRIIPEFDQTWQRKYGCEIEADDCIDLYKELLANEDEWNERGHAICYMNETLKWLGNSCMVEFGDVDMFYWSNNGTRDMCAVSPTIPVPQTARICRFPVTLWSPSFVFQGGFWTPNTGKLHYVARSRMRH